MIKQMRANLMLFAAAFIWGSAFVAQSEGMNYIGPFTYVFARSVTGTLFLALILPFFISSDKRKGNKTSFKTSLTGGICCGLVMFAATSFQQFGLTETSAGKSGFITSLYIIIVPLLGVFVKKKTPLRVILCTVIAVTGFYLLCIKEDFSIEKGDILVLVSAFFFSLHILTVDYFSAGPVNPVLMSCIQFFVVSLVSLPAMTFFETPEISSITKAAVPILYAGVLSSGVAFTLQIYAQKDTKPAVATMIMSLESVFAAVSGWIVLNEVFSLRELSGCILVFAAVIAAQLPARKTLKQ